LTGSCSMLIEYPDVDEEKKIVTQYGSRVGAPGPADFGISPQADAKTLDAAAEAVKSVKLVEDVVDYIVRLIRATRETADLENGASPRAAISWPAPRGRGRPLQGVIM